MNEEPMDSFHKSNLASILLANWNIPHSSIESLGPSAPLHVPPHGLELNRASRYLLPEYQSLSQDQLSSRNNKDQVELRYDLLVDLFKSTASDSANAFTKLFTFGAEMQIWRKGRVKQCTVFLDQHVPTLIWVSSLTKAFLFDIAYTTFTRFDAEFQVSSPCEHYIILRYFQEEIPFLFQSDTEAQRYFDLFVNYRSFNRVKNQYPPYFSKLIKYYTLAEMTSDCKRSKTVGEILKIADNISGSDKKEEYLEIVRQMVEGRPKSQHLKEKKLSIQEIVLDDTQVMQFMKIASCNQNLKAIFQYYAQVPMKSMLNYTAPLMDLKQFKRFLIEEQHEPLNSIDKIIQKFAQCSNPFITHQDYLSFYQFCSYCCRMDINYLVLQPELNRNLPITDYFIWSSHNTYLSGNQLTSDAKVERYLEDLNDGIKCVEIDVHDDGNTPIVTHALKGIHLNRSVTFEEVIKQISMYCKKNQNFDPLILSIQNHASEQNRYTMVNIIFKYLERYLFTLEDENIELDVHSSKQSSEFDRKSVGANLQCRTLKELRGKVIIKTDSKIQNILSQKRRKTNKHKKGINLEVGRMKQPRYFPNNSFTERFKEHELMDKRMQIRKQKFIEEFPINYYQNLNDQMARVTGMFKNHQGLNNPNPLCYQCISITNKSLKKIPLPQSQTYTKKSFMRVYPVGTELASGNYNPIHGLQRGAQIIAINTQTKDDFAWLMMSYFTAGKTEEVKSIGYVEKPEHLKSNYANRNEINTTQNPKSIPKIAQVKKIQSATEQTGFKNTFELIFRPSREVLFPKRVQLSILATNYQVNVKFFGTDLDKQRNRDSKYSFDIYDYNEAFLMFEIGQNIKDCVPVRFLQEGYRVIAGRNSRYNDCGVRILVKAKIKLIQN